MAELTNQERLQPSLLDRLTDDEPDETQESRAKRVLSINRLRACVIRDLAWLLNTGSMEEITSLSPYPEIKKTVLNYGTLGLIGHSVSKINAHEVERQLRQSILDFEPRILRNSVKVHMCTDNEKMDQSVVQFEIEGDLWAQPVPLRLFMKTEVDLESGNVSVSESGSKKVN